MATQIQWEDVNGPSHSLLSPGYVTAKNSQLFFTSGCVGTDKSGKLAEGVEAQTKLALENLKVVLEAGGSSLSNVLKVLLFVGDGSYASAVNSVYQEYFPGRPGRSCVVVAFPDPAIKVELECVAVVPEKD